MSNASNIKVIGARMVLIPEHVDNKTASGIYIPDKAQEETFTGVVVAVGEGQRLESGAHFPMSVNVGDKVLYMRTSGVPVEYDGVTHIVINESHVLAIFPKEG